MRALGRTRLERDVEPVQHDHDLVV